MLVDLFCGQGGASRGYELAGFAVRGVDVKPQPRYPYPFCEADALEYLAGLTAADLCGIDAFHASPPCQAYSVTRSVWKRGHPMLVEDVRAALAATGKPFVMENVPGAPLVNAYTLCGGGFGLGTGGRHLKRHRLFECHGFDLGLVPPCSHFGHQAVGVYGHGAWDNSTSDRRGGYQASKAEAVAAMGVDWMTLRGLAQAIPPAMTEFVGTALREQLERNRRSAFDAIPAEPVGVHAGAASQEVAEAAW